MKQVIEKALRDGIDFGIGCGGIVTNTKENHFVEQWLNKNLPKPTQLISQERRLAMLTGAIEGGSNYWYNITETGCAIINNATKGMKKKTPFVDRLFAALEKGVVIEIHDIELNEAIGELSMATMTEREYNMLQQQPQHFADIISEDDDAQTADVWFQFVVLNKLVYG